MNIYNNLVLVALAILKSTGLAPAFANTNVVPRRAADEEDEFEEQQNDKDLPNSIDPSSAIIVASPTNEHIKESSGADIGILEGDRILGKGNKNGKGGKKHCKDIAMQLADAQDMIEERDTKIASLEKTVEQLSKVIKPDAGNDLFGSSYDRAPYNAKQCPLPGFGDQKIIDICQSICQYPTYPQMSNNYRE